jgi:hypothetical protein
MEAEEIFTAVEKKWGAFDGSRYPALMVLTGDQPLSFCLTHVLRHQFRLHHNFPFMVLAYMDGVEVDGVEDSIRGTLSKLIFNSVRFCGLLPEFEKDISEWEGLSDWRRAKGNRKVCADILTWSRSDLAVGISALEPVDHGSTLPLDELRKFGKRMLHYSTMLASRCGYSSDDFLATLK